MCVLPVAGRGDPSTETENPLKRDQLGKAPTAHGTQVEWGNAQVVYNSCN